MYFEDWNRTPNAEIGPKGIFEIASKQNCPTDDDHLPGRVFRLWITSSNAGCGKPQCAADEVLRAVCVF